MLKNSTEERGCQTISLPDIAACCRMGVNGARLLARSSSSGVPETHARCRSLGSARVVVAGVGVSEQLRADFLHAGEHRRPSLLHRSHGQTECYLTAMSRSSAPFCGQPSTTPDRLRAGQHGLLVKKEKIEDGCGLGGRLFSATLHHDAILGFGRHRRVPDAVKTDAIWRS